MEAWCRSWLIPLNPSKSTVLHLGYNNPQLEYQLSNLQTILAVESQVDLGITMNSELKWSDHITTIVKRANSICYLLQKAFQHPDKKLFLKLYTTYIRPYLEYAVQVWCPHFKKDIDAIEKVQRRITKWVPNISHLSYAKRLSYLNLTTLEERRSRGDLIFTYKVLHQAFSTDMSNLFNLNTDTRLRGHSFKLTKENFRSSARQHFLTNRVFTTWNSLPDTIVSAPSTNSFKNKYDAHMCSVR